MAFTPEILVGLKAEFLAWDRLPAAMKQPGGFGTLGDLPLIVIRRGKGANPPSEADLKHREGQPCGSNPSPRTPSGRSPGRP